MIKKVATYCIQRHAFRVAEGNVQIWNISCSAEVKPNQSVTTLRENGTAYFSEYFGKFIASEHSIPKTKQGVIFSFNDDDEEADVDDDNDDAMDG